MSGVGTLDSAEQEEFLAAVRRQSIGRLCDVRASNTLAGKLPIDYARFLFFFSFFDFSFLDFWIELFKKHGGRKIIKIM